MVIVQGKIKNQNGSSSSLFLTVNESGTCDWTTGEFARIKEFVDISSAVELLSRCPEEFKSNLIELHFLTNN